jgi:hypothetical protein
MPRGDEIPLKELLKVARRRRDRALENGQDPIRFRASEANHVAELDAVIHWLEGVPFNEWVDEYLEDPR